MIRAFCFVLVLTVLLLGSSYAVSASTNPSYSLSPQEGGPVFPGQTYDFILDLEFDVPEDGVLVIVYFVEKRNCSSSSCRDQMMSEEFTQEEYTHHQVRIQKTYTVPCDAEEGRIIWYSVSLLSPSGSDVLKIGWTVGSLPNPDPSFSVSPGNLAIDTEVTFQDTTSYPIPLTERRWSLDGVPIGSGKSVSRTFSADGSHEVSLEVQHPCTGTWFSETRTILVAPPLPPPPIKTAPTADLTVWERRPTIGQEVRFEATSMSDPDGGDIAELQWDFDDGILLRGSEAELSTVYHTFSFTGLHTVTLTVCDDQGECTSYSAYIVVSGAPANPSESSPPETTSSQSSPIQTPIVPQELPVPKTYKPEAQMTVLFDEIHDGRRTSDWERAEEIAASTNAQPEWTYFDMSYLSNGFGWSSWRQRITDPSESNSPLAIAFASPHEDLTDQELYAIETYLASGGALILFGDWGYQPPPAFNQLLAGYGISLDPENGFNRGERAYPESGEAMYISNWGQIVEYAEMSDIMYDSVWRYSIRSTPREERPPFLVAGVRGSARIVVAGDDAFHEQKNTGAMKYILDFLWETRPASEPIWGAEMPIRYLVNANSPSDAESLLIIDDFTRAAAPSRIGGIYDYDCGLNHNSGGTASCEFEWAKPPVEALRVVFDYSDWLKFGLWNFGKLDLSDATGIEITAWTETPLDLSIELGMLDTDGKWVGFRSPSLLLTDDPRTFRIPFSDFRGNSQSGAISKSSLENVVALAFFPSSNTGSVVLGGLAAYGPDGALDELSSSMDPAAHQELIKTAVPDWNSIPYIQEYGPNSAIGYWKNGSKPIEQAEFWGLAGSELGGIKIEFVPEGLLVRFEGFENVLATPYNYDIRFSEPGWYNRTLFINIDPDSERVWLAASSRSLQWTDLGSQAVRAKQFEPEAVTLLIEDFELPFGVDLSRIQDWSVYPHIIYPVPGGDDEYFALPGGRSYEEMKDLQRYLISAEPDETGEVEILVIDDFSGSRPGNQSHLNGHYDYHSGESNRPGSDPNAFCDITWIGESPTDGHLQCEFGHSTYLGVGLLADLPVDLSTATGIQVDLWALQPMEIRMNFWGKSTFAWSGFESIDLPVSTTTRTFRVPFSDFFSGSTQSGIPEDNLSQLIHFWLMPSVERGTLFIDNFGFYGEPGSLKSLAEMLDTWQPYIVDLVSEPGSEYARQECDGFSEGSIPINWWYSYDQTEDGNEYTALEVMENEDGRSYLRYRYPEDGNQWVAKLQFSDNARPINASEYEGIEVTLRADRETTVDLEFSFKDCAIDSGDSESPCGNSTAGIDHVILVGKEITTFRIPFSAFSVHDWILTNFPAAQTSFLPTAITEVAFIVPDESNGTLEIYDVAFYGALGATPLAEASSSDYLMAMRSPTEKLQYCDGFSSGSLPISWRYSSSTTEDTREYVSLSTSHPDGEYVCYRYPEDGNRRYCTLQFPDYPSPVDASAYDGIEFAIRADGLACPP